MESKTIEELYNLHNVMAKFKRIKSKDSSHPRLKELAKEIEDMWTKIDELLYIEISSLIMDCSSTLIHSQQLIIKALEKGPHIYDSNYLEVKKLMKESEEMRNKCINHLNSLELWRHYPYSLYLKPK